jgi:hypothetical protein
VPSCDCRTCRRIDDIDPQWLVDYANKNPGVFFKGTVENIDQLKQDLGSTEWHRMLAAWRRYKQQQGKLTAALKEFHHACQDLNLAPHEVLQVLTAHLEANDCQAIQRDIEAMREVYSSVYGPQANEPSRALAAAVETSSDDIEE